MGSTLLFKGRICLKPFYHRGSFFTLNSSIFKSSHLPLSARSLCTRGPFPKPGARHTDRSSDTQGGVNKSTFQNREEDFGDGARRGKSSTVRQKPSFPKSVFAAGTAKRTAEIQKRKAALFFQEEEQHGGRTASLQPPDRPLSAAEWRDLKESRGNAPRFDIRMMVQLFTTAAELNIAKSLLTFVATETGTLSYELLLRYLTLCVRGGHDAEAFDVYEIMQGNFPALDTGASCLFIQSFSRTERWREAISILEEIKKVCTPSSSNYGEIVTAAMLNGDTTTAWALYDEIIEKGRTPHQETWEALFKAAGKIKQEEAMSASEHQERLLGILLYMRDNQIYPQHGLTSTINAWFERLSGQKWTGSLTSATPKGVCRCCGSQLESIKLTDEEYQQLKDRVMADIIQGRDVFEKTTPEELERFKAFVKKRPAFDVVVDGLNIAYRTNDTTRLSETLLAVVSELERQGLTVLVLGRKHMLRASRSWDRNNMMLIQKKAHCFFTENISEDDPFMLYATLHSGNHCRFVSRDMMRDHKACLPDGATRRLFFKWQRGHQLVVDEFATAGKRVRFQSIPTYDTIVQTSADSWHVPYDDTEDRGTCEVPQKWLCLTTKH
ncbi:mitochondrial ribonuclease P catalytic subunit [Trematomus bernacchii]|uniref:mitochondrial ribonuclease P catalytic subunit n=1 Tax=Trematomus bernacchii TaxID=40690 RepID=UPI00146B0849|nr:mitochondrial ribonuclease P catalytic subunit [Trematomus bernacchii]